MGGSIASIYPRLILGIEKFTGSNNPKICIETGTYHGDSAAVFAKLFQVVHTIELSLKWYTYAKEKLSIYKNVFCHLGDGAEVLLELLPNIEQPILFFLDSHFSGGDTAFGKEEVPLLRELDVICTRNQRDIIIIDDSSFIGKCGHSEGGGNYPPMKYDWRDVTIQNIQEITGRNIRNPWIFGGDRILIFRNRSVLQGLIINSIKIILKPFHFSLIHLRK